MNQNQNRTFHLIKAFNFFVYGAIAVYSTFFVVYLQSIGMSTLEIGALMAAARLFPSSRTRYGVI